MIIFQKDFRFSDCPSVHLQPDQQESAFVSVWFHLLVIAECQEAISGIQKL